DIGRKGDTTESADIDDLGEIIYNDDGTIIYPTTMLDAFMRHRKYNWDILWCTPDILQVLMLIRGATEKAFHYSQKDVLKLLARRPRVREHLAKENGLTHKKGNPVKFLKVPLDVHKLYKSTATGQITKSGVGDSPFKALKWPLIFTVGLLSIMALYNLLFSGSDSPEQANTTGNQTAQNRIEIKQSGTVKSADMASLANSAKTDPKAAIDVALPYQGKEIYLVGTERITENGEFKEWLLYYELVTKEGIINLSNKELRHYGINARYVAECFSNLIWQDKIYSVYCRPEKPLENKAEIKTSALNLFG
ncbi:zonular occludens toxin domain-containing protein, partial [Alteromonas sp. a30]|uniref:zonular occludens toxin domain-containing protein n=1 Tax=Alteromonas sp. a30 TaxID=2730917 RepID=UPI002DDCBF92